MSPPTSRAKTRASNPLDAHRVNENNTETGGGLRFANVSSPLGTYDLDLFGTNYVMCDSGGQQPGAHDYLSLQFTLRAETS